MRVMVHPANSSWCQGGFLRAVRCFQSLLNAIYALKTTLLPVSEIQNILHWSRLNAQLTRSRRRMWISCMNYESNAPVSVSTSPAVPEESTRRLSAVFIFILIFSSQKPTCQSIWLLIRVFLSVYIYFSFIIKQKFSNYTTNVQKHKMLAKKLAQE